MIRRRMVSGLAVLGALAPQAEAQAPPRPQPYCVREVALDRTGEGKRVSLLLRNGAIEAILDEAAPTPPGTRVIDGTGLVCLPAFLDAFSRRGCTVPQPVKDQDVPPNELADVGVDMRLANRKGIQPAFRAVEALAVAKDQAQAWQKSGFGAALVSPGGEILSGSSALVTTREAAMRDLVLRREVFAHAAFAANGPGYPSTLMGYIAQLRQFLLDSQRHGELKRRYEQSRPGLRPPFDAELEAGSDLVSGRRMLLCEAESAGDIERWLKLADEFGLSLAIGGGREAWRVISALAERRIPVVLTLDWGKEVKDPRPKEEKKKGEKEGEKEQLKPEEKPQETGQPPKSEVEAEIPEGEAAAAEGGVSDAQGKPVTKEESKEVWEYEEPYEVRLERRRKWEDGRDCALRLQEGGVRFAFGTASEKPSKLLANVRTLVKQGLSADAALAALTTDAAELLGAQDRLGRIEPGYDATFTLWRKDPLTDEKASAAWVFVDGFPTEFKEEKKDEKAGPGPAEGIDPTGTWELEFEADEEGLRKATLVLEMAEGGAVSGKLSATSPMDGSKVESDVAGHVSKDELELEVTLAFGELKIDAKLTATVEKDALDGEGSFKGPWADEPKTQSFRGKRRPKAQ